MSPAIVASRPQSVRSNNQANVGKQFQNLFSNFKEYKQIECSTVQILENEYSKYILVDP